jgi:hypothetical protein
LLGQKPFLVAYDGLTKHLLIPDVILLRVLIFLERNVLMHEVAALIHLCVVKLSDNVLLLDHLDLFDDDLKVDQGKIVKMLEKDPELSHCSTIDHLHQLGHLHMLVALKRFEWHVALMREFFKHIG